MAKVSDLAYIDPNGVYKNTVKIENTYTAPDGTVYEARASALGNGIVKVTTNADGTTSEDVLVFHKTVGVDKKKSTGAKIRKNQSQVNKEFDGFVSAAEALAESGSGSLSYTDADITAGGGGFLQSDKNSSVNLKDSDGNVVATISSNQGKTGAEINRVKTLADELLGIDFSAGESGGGDDDEVVDEKDDDTRIDSADEIVDQDVSDALDAVDLGDSDEADEAETILSEVGDAAESAFGGDEVGDTVQDTSSFTNTSILGSGGGGGSVNVSDTADSGQAEKDASISVGPAEDDAIDFYTEGRRSTIMTSASGLLTDPEDPSLRRRRSLLAG